MIEWAEDEEFMEKHKPGGKIMRAVRRYTKHSSVEAMVFAVLMDDGTACMTYEGEWHKVEMLLNSVDNEGTH